MGPDVVRRPDTAVGTPGQRPSVTSPPLLVEGVQRTRALVGDGALGPAVAAAADSARRVLTLGPWTVTDKAWTPGGADHHDFVHVADYAWPDPDRPDGLPWVIRDGRVNPDAAGMARDGAWLRELGLAVRALTLGWWVTGDAAMAERVALLVRTWFTDATTRMRPALDHAVVVPGRTEPAGWGLARLQAVTDVVDCVELLEAGAVDWSGVAGFRTWCADLCDWLRSSQLLRSEIDRGNNHTTWALDLVLALATHAGATDPFDVLPASPMELLDAQVGPDGRQPAEESRPRSFYYCGFNAAGMLSVARRAGRLGLDLSRPDDPPRRALDAMVDALVDPSSWPHGPGPEPTDRRRHGDLLVRATAFWPDVEGYRTALGTSALTPRADHPVWIECGIDPPRIAR